MKSEHRHDLETNWLAHHMAVWIEQLKPHTTKLVLLAGTVVGLMVVISISSSVSASKDKAAWEAYAMAVNSTDPELMQLQQVAEEYPDTTMQEWAYATWADRQLMIASRRYLIDREAAHDRLRKTQGYYDTLTLAGDPQIRDRAHFGLARIYEMLDQLEKSKTEYALVQGDLASLAAERTGQLESDEVQQACEWLATTELPKRTAPTDTGLLGGRPPFASTAASIGDDVLSQKSMEELLGEPLTPEKTAAPEQTATPKQESPKQETPKQESSEQESSEQETPKQESSKQESSKQESSEQESSEQESSGQTDKPAETDSQENSPVGNETTEETGDHQDGDPAQPNEP